MVPISVMFPNLPIAVHRKRDIARKQFEAIFTKVIQARKASGQKEEDVLQQFIDAKCVFLPARFLVTPLSSILS